MTRARRKLLKQADSETRVTYEDIFAAAGLEDNASSRTMQDPLRAKGVRFRPPRKKVQVKAGGAKLRLQVAKEWVKRPVGYWTDNVHAYIDNKQPLLPLTPAQRRKFRQSRATGHLRTTAEGVLPECTKPKTNHSFLGMPSVTVTAAVAVDRIILWHVHGKQRNGQTAADTYEGPIKKALAKFWGPKRHYRIIEDGDRKGNQSGKGLLAKERAKLKAMTLPPRTPSCMPLNYASWEEILRRMDGTAPEGTETKDEYLRRLKRTATSLPKGYVRAVLARMKKEHQVYY